MFHTIKLKKINFCSNPELDPLPVPDYTVNENGDPINRYVYQKPSNLGLQGAHYDPSIMSLRARLNRGVELQYVNYDQTENDPNVLRSLELNFAKHIDSVILARHNAPVSSVVESQFE